jgi:hypothetical protein
MFVISMIKVKGSGSDPFKTSSSCLSVGATPETGQGLSRLRYMFFMPVDLLGGAAALETMNASASCSHRPMQAKITKRDERLKREDGSFCTSSRVLPLT